jgi:hypothetical protein
MQPKNKHFEAKHDFIARKLSLPPTFGILGIGVYHETKHTACPINFPKALSHTPEGIVFYHFLTLCSLSSSHL